MLEELKELWRFRELLGVMVKRDLRVRYKNSALGVLWSFITPLAMTAIITVVFKVFLRMDIPSYSAYYLAAFLPFTFLQTTILDSSQSVLSSLPVVEKIYFPREVLPLTSIVSNFVHFLFGFVIFFLYVLFIFAGSVLRHDHPLQFPLQPTAVLLPVLMLITVMLGTGLSLLVCALNTFYEDVKHIVTVLLYLMMFACPIMYFVEFVANSSINREPYFWVYKLYNLNPFAALCIGYRKILLANVKVPHAPDPVTGNALWNPEPLNWGYLGFCAFISAITLILGYAVFNKVKWKFAERP